MSVITSNWMPSQAEAPTGHPTKAGTEFSREMEFRAVLEGYLADYREHLTTLRRQGGEPVRTE